MTKLKRFIPIFIISILLCGCDENETASNQESTEPAPQVVENTEQTETSNEEETVVEDIENAERYITPEEYNSYFETVEITVDNWQEYLEVKEERSDKRDAFGELTGAYIVVDVMELKSKYIYPKEKVVLRISGEFVPMFLMGYTGKGIIWETTFEDEDIIISELPNLSASFTSMPRCSDTNQVLITEETIVDPNGEVSYYTQIESYSFEVTKAQGSVMIFNPPTDDKYNIDEEKGGEKYLAIDSNGEITYVYETSGYGSSKDNLIPYEYGLFAVYEKGFNQ